MIENNNFLPGQIRNVFIVLLFLVLAIYSNTYTASWHMDDYHTIVMNADLQINDLKPSSLAGTFYSHYGDKSRLYRPVSCLSFALNWYVGKNNPAGYHVVNNLIHFLNGFFLFLFICGLFQTPAMKNTFKQSEYFFIALLTVCFWVINPSQTQAVTYIVQRMASLAALFYIVSMLFYIKGRMAKARRTKFFLFICCALSFLMALGSKEIAATLPLTLFMIEMIFFQNHLKLNVKKMLFVTAVSLLVGFVIFVLAEKSIVSFFLKQYENRPFTLVQRLLTEPRILIFYISQFFYPVPSRLSVSHDTDISVSLFHPWTTLPSILLILFLLLMAILIIRKSPLTGFSILFFFLNHILESSAIGLELMFEHRNYLPSFFLFLPAAIGFNRLLNYYHKQKRLLHFMLVFFMTALLTGLGIGTYARNITWATEKTLWEDAMSKAPASARPPHNLAWGYYEPLNHYEAAFELYRTSLGLNWPDNRDKADALYGMAGIHFKKKEYEKAVELYKKALKVKPDDEMSYKQLIMVLIVIKNWDAALTNSDLALSYNPKNEYFLNQKGLILLKKEKYEHARDCFTLALKQNPFSIKPLTGIGACLELAGYYNRSEWFFKLAHSLYPTHVSPLLLLIDLNLKIENMIAADQYADKLLSMLSAEMLAEKLKTLYDKPLMDLISKRPLVTALSIKINKASKEISGLKKDS